MVITSTGLTVLTVLNVSSSNLALSPKVDTNKLALKRNNDDWHDICTMLCKKKKRFTKREELSFLMVFAFPNASRTGLAWIT
jgi:hypothetical protein